MPRIGAVLAIAALVAAAACGGGAPAGGTTPVDRESLRPEEWGTRNFYSAYDAISALRPAWLNLRGPEGQVQVYVDDNHLGGVDVLRTIRSSSISVIRHLDGIQASARYGLNHDQGAILVSTRATTRN